jgi:hypothetical protein
MFRRLSVTILALAIGAPSLAFASPEGHLESLELTSRYAEHAGRPASPLVERSPLSRNLPPRLATTPHVYSHSRGRHAADVLREPRSAPEHQDFQDIRDWMDEACRRSADCAQQGMLMLFDPTRNNGISLDKVLSMHRSLARSHVMRVGRTAARAVRETHTTRTTVTGSDGQPERKRVTVQDVRLDHVEHALPAMEMDALHMAALNQAFERDPTSLDAVASAVALNWSAVAGGRPTTLQRKASELIRASAP